MISEAKFPKLDNQIVLQILLVPRIHILRQLNHVLHKLLLYSNNTELLLETKKALSTSFDMKDLGEALFVLGIDIDPQR